MNEFLCRSVTTIADAVIPAVNDYNAAVRELGYATTDKERNAAERKVTGAFIRIKACLIMVADIAGETNHRVSQPTPKDL